MDGEVLGVKALGGVKAAGEEIGAVITAIMALLVAKDGAMARAGAKAGLDGAKAVVTGITGKEKVTALVVAKDRLRALQSMLLRRYRSPCKDFRRRS